MRGAFPPCGTWIPHPFNTTCVLKAGHAGYHAYETSHGTLNVELSDEEIQRTSSVSIETKDALRSYTLGCRVCAACAALPPGRPPYRPNSAPYAAPPVLCSPRYGTGCAARPKLAMVAFQAGPLHGAFALHYAQEATSRRDLLARRLLQEIGLDKTQVWATTLVKCPPNVEFGRTPREFAVACTSKNLIPEIRLVQPELVFCFGRDAYDYYTAMIKDGLGRPRFHSAKPYGARSVRNGTVFASLDPDPENINDQDDWLASVMMAYRDNE